MYPFLCQLHLIYEFYRYYSAVYAKASTRKHKKFEDDGYITVTNGNFVTLKVRSTSFTIKLLKDF